MISIFDFLNVYSVLGCVIAVLFWFYIKSANNYWRKLNVKYLEPVPFFGNTAKIVFRRTTFHDGYHNFYRALDKEPYGGVYQLSQPQLIVKDPELVYTILVKDFNHFHDRSLRLIVNQNKELNPMSLHLFFTQGERWRVLRQKISPVFTSGKLKHMHDQVLDCVTSLTNYIDERLDENGSMDVALKQLFEKLTIDVIGSCAFGIECNSMKANQQFSEVGREAFKPRVSQIIRVLLASLSPRLLNLLKIPDFPKDVTDFFRNLTFDTMDYRRKNGVTRADLLQLLMELQNSYVDPKFTASDQSKKVLTTEKFDEIDIAANSFLFFNAGFETTATTLSYCFYELAMNQDIQERLRSEVQHFKDKNPDQILDYEDLKDMIYMDAVVHETLRKYPPLVVLNRECTEEYEMPDTKTRIPVGTQVIIPVWSIQHDWKNYANPEVFDPERFLGDNHSRHSGKFLSFGEGPHYCIGKRFADMEIKSALAEMILKYDFKPCAKTEIPLKFKKGSVLLQTTCGTWANLQKRK